MLLLISIAVLVTVTCTAKPIQPRRNMGEFRVFEKHMTDKSVITDRKKRASLGRMALEGARAVMKIVQGTVRTSFTKTGREHEKLGTVKTALADFRAVINPRNTEKLKLPNGEIIRVGDVGDRRLILKSGGKDGIPTIEILKKGDALSDKGTHIEKILYKTNIPVERLF